MNPLYKNLYSYMTFRRWWANKLTKRPTNLYDYQTGKMMSLEKRFTRELPKIQDLCDFVNSLDAGVMITFSTDRKYYITITDKFNDASLEGTDLIETFINAILLFLDMKEKNEKERGV